MTNMTIRATYYIFCCRNRNWDRPDLMQFWFLFFFWLLFCFCFCFFLFNNPISSSICKLPIRGEIYNCTFKNKNKVSIIIIIIIVVIIIVIGTYYYHFITAVLNEVEISPECITLHPGFSVVCLNRWSLRSAASKYKRIDGTKYRQTDTEEKWIMFCPVFSFRTISNC